MSTNRIVHPHLSSVYSGSWRNVKSYFKTIVKHSFINMYYSFLFVTGKAVQAFIMCYLSVKDYLEKCIIKLYLGITYSFLHKKRACNRDKHMWKNQHQLADRPPVGLLCRQLSHFAGLPVTAVQIQVVDNIPLSCH